MAPPHVALATVADAWPLDEDAPLLMDALAAEGVRAEPVMWDDDRVDWAGFDLVVVRSTWDYARRLDEFRRWIRLVERATVLANPGRVLVWNIDKRYLADLAAAGVDVVPTTYLLPGTDAAAVADALPEGAELVVKPTVSAGARDTARYRAEDRAAAVRHAAELLEQGREVMVQPYLAAVDELGETGLVFFDGELSHAFRKGPLLAPGAAPDEALFALEEITEREPAADEVELATQVLDRAAEILDGAELLYARVDTLRDDSGRPILLELELTEPSFFLQTAPGAAERVAAAIARRARDARAARPRTPK